MAWQGHVNLFLPWKRKYFHFTSEFVFFWLKRFSPRYYYSASVREQSNAMIVSVSVVSTRISPKTTWPTFTKCLWPWLGPLLAALQHVMYSRFVDDDTSSSSSRKDAILVAEQYRTARFPIMDSVTHFNIGAEPADCNCLVCADFGSRTWRHMQT